MTSQYARGTTFERAVRDCLRGDGYEVIRSAGSKGKVDLVAFKKGQILFIQCKLNGLCAPSERAEVLRLSSLVGALPIVAYKGTEGRQRPVRYRLLTGPGPKEFVGWISDKADEELERLARELDLPDAKMFPFPRLGDPSLGDPSWERGTCSKCETPILFGYDEIGWTHTTNVDCHYAEPLLSE